MCETRCGSGSLFFYMIFYNRQNFRLVLRVKSNIVSNIVGWYGNDVNCGRVLLNPIALKFLQ